MCKYVCGNCVNTFNELSQLSLLLLHIHIAAATTVSTALAAFGEFTAKPRKYGYFEREGYRQNICIILA